jgi:energy-coupling factor transporter transmembrane protein EcfT
MEISLVYAVVGGIVLVLIFFIARLAIRWAIRLVIIGLLLVAALGGIGWWWLSRTTQSDTKPRTTPTRRATPERR